MSVRCVESGFFYHRDVPQVAIPHRRRINTKEKAKVVASVWGTEFIPFLATLAVLPRTVLNNRMNCSRII